MKIKIARELEEGFTLIELLTTVAIIGILASTIFVSLSGQRKRAKLASAMETSRSVVPAAIECYMTNKILTGPNAPATGGGVVCAGSTTSWPSLGDTDCTYTALDTTNNRWRVTCENNTYVSCFAMDGGNCCQSSAGYVCN